MSAQELMAGKQWVERRFVEIVREFGAARTLTQEDRWRQIHKPPMSHSHSMSYYIELAGHLKRGVITFTDVDLEIVGGGEPTAQDTLSRHIRDALVSLGNRESGGGRSHAVSGRL